MAYLSDRKEAYRHPQSVLQGCRSVVMLAMQYTRPGSIESTEYRIGSYACGDSDYHNVIHERLKMLCRYLSKAFPASRQRGIVDTAPLLERDFARMAGLGWIGKNTLLLNRQHGSHFFLAAVLTDVPLKPDEPMAKDHCGSCTACLEACPTQAFPEPHVLDASRCISYLTIEHRDVIPLELRSMIGNWLFGCDICQIVCPWNRKSKSQVLEEFKNDDRMTRRPLEYWLSLDEFDFRTNFRHTPLWRTKLTGIQRNAMIVAANTNRRDLIPILERFRSHESLVLRETCQWALSRLS